MRKILAIGTIIILTYASLAAANINIIDNNIIISEENISNQKQMDGNDSWLMFRHDSQHTGCSNCKAPNTNNSIWNFTNLSDNKAFVSSPAVANEKLYINSVNGTIYCLDSANGSLIWNFKLTIKYGSMLSSPAVNNDKVYIGSEDGLYCFYANNGTIAWINDTIDYISSSPTIYNDKVYVGNNEGLYCLNAENGNILWVNKNGSSIFSSPAVYDDKVFIGTSDGNVTCFYTNNGSFIWTQKTYSWYSSPAVFGNKSFIGSLDSNVYCLNVSDGSIIWNFSTNDLIFSSPAVHEGKVYIGSDNNKVYCLDIDTGNLIWNSSDIGIIESSPSIADNKLYVGSYNDNIYCLNPSNGEIIWSYQTGSYVFSSPAICYGKVYVGTEEGTVHCFADEELPNQPPYIPSDPNPENNASQVDINVNLSWTGGDPDEGDTVTYDVFLIEVPSPTPSMNKISDNQTCTYYHVDGLDFGKKYYWKIVAWDNHNASTDGPKWAFNTRFNQPPNITNPFPEDGATNIDIIADLKWTGEDPDGDPIKYDVYFGNTTPPPKTVENQTSTIYDPGVMDFNQTYYWQITARDSYGAQSTSPIWYFITRENLPPIIGDPSPSNDSKDVDINEDLSWSGADPDEGDTVNYDVYFGQKDNLTLRSEKQSKSSYELEKLDYATTYYWQIIARDNHNASTEGAVWCFTTEKPPNKPPKINIEKPQKAIYINNQRVLPRLFLMPLVIGDITIKVNVTDPDSEVQKVEFYINNQRKHICEEPNGNGLYTYTWTRDRFRVIHIFFLKIVAYDEEDKAGYKMLVRKYL